jgi:hypothetical protein
MCVPGTQVTDGLTRVANNLAAISWILKTNGDPRLLTVPIEREILAVDGQMPVAKVRTMDQVIGDNVARQSFSMLLLSLFAGIALLLGGDRYLWPDVVFSGTAQTGLGLRTHPPAGQPAVRRECERSGHLRVGRSHSVHGSTASELYPGAPRHARGSNGCAALRVNVKIRHDQ